MAPAPFDSEARPTMDSESARAHAFPLALAAVGERLRIASFQAGKGMGRRLNDIGLNPGSEIEVVHRQRGGSVVVSKGNTRVALGAGMTYKIVVTLVDAPAPAAPGNGAAS